MFLGSFGIVVSFDGSVRVEDQPVSTAERDRGKIKVGERKLIVM